MGCINGKSPLTEEDMNYIARNTAMEKDAVEVTAADATDDQNLLRPSQKFLYEEILCCRETTLFAVNVKFRTVLPVWRNQIVDLDTGGTPILLSNEYFGTST